MNYTIDYYNETVKTDIELLPIGLRVRYAVCLNCVLKALKALHECFIALELAGELLCCTVLLRKHLKRRLKNCGCTNSNKGNNA